MRSKTDINETKGSYFGTEIDEKWWKRYYKNKLLARGSGTYWYNDDSFFFLRILTKKPIAIPLKNITEYKIGKWHAGRWGKGYPILKILWSKEGCLLSSGFLISKNKADVDLIISKLTNTAQGV